MARVDLNADLGEGAGDDEAMLALVTSANVACGFHAGDAATMRATCAAARARGVVIGAHVGYRDREGFGRRETGAPAETIGAECAEQLAALADAARGGRRAVRQAARRSLHALRERPRGGRRGRRRGARAAGLGVVLGPAGLGAARQRRRRRGSSPSPRASPIAATSSRAGGPRCSGASTTARCSRRQDAVAQAVLIARRGVAVAPDGSEIAVAARSICLHGDTPGAAGIASAVRAALEEAGVAIEPFA